MKCMPKTIFFELDKQAVMDHYKRICRGNLRNKYKCCKVCPFREQILQFVGIVENTKEKKK